MSDQQSGISVKGSPIKLIILFILILYIAYRIIYPNLSEEQFQPNSELADYNEYDDLYGMPNTNRTNLLDDGMATNYLPASEFLKIVSQINQKIITVIVGYGKMCQGTNGEDLFMGNENKRYSGNSENRVSLNCVTNSQEIEDEALMGVYKIIFNEMYNRFKIKFNLHMVMHDLYNDLDLLEGIIYPLQYSQLYTVHGVQYTTVQNIQKMVDTQLRTKDVLYTIISRRGVVLINDTDTQLF
jgi:hypothetical protein